MNSSNKSVSVQVNVTVPGDEPTVNTTRRTAANATRIPVASALRAPVICKAGDETLTLKLRDRAIKLIGCDEAGSPRACVAYFTATPPGMALPDPIGPPGTNTDGVFEEVPVGPAPNREWHIDFTGLTNPCLEDPEATVVLTAIVFYRNESLTEVKWFPAISDIEVSCANIEDCGA